MCERMEKNTIRVVKKVNRYNDIKSENSYDNNVTIIT